MEKKNPIPFLAACFTLLPSFIKWYKESHSSLLPAPIPEMMTTIPIYSVPTLARHLLGASPTSSYTTVFYPIAEEGVWQGWAKTPSCSGVGS